MHSFSALLQAYFTDLRVKNWSNATINRRQYSLGRFTDWLTERSIETLLEVTPEIISAYQRSLYHIGNLRSKKPLRSATQSSYLSAVSHWLQWACVKKFLPFNPAIDLELPKEEHRLPASYLSMTEAELPTVIDRENQRLTSIRQQVGRQHTRTINQIKHILRRHNLQWQMPTKTFPSKKAIEWVKVVELSRLQKRHV